MGNICSNKSLVNYIFSGIIKIFALNPFYDASNANAKIV